MIFRICLVLILATPVRASGPVSGGYHISAGDNLTINEHSVTRKVTNNHASGLTIYVPTTTTTEWSTFVNSPPAGVTVEIPCAGSLVGGYCWYAGANGDSCDDVCTTHGGYHSASQTYAGSSGTDQNCTDVLNALAMAGSGSAAASNLFGLATGCSTYGSIRYRLTATTTSSASYGTLKRACACQN